ncbi:hypothetical protein O181_110853 [Austropuccinia psidii MF-1]|uniref:Uncharacterized protein n=1 Tax=Austropuccinia psidii MF-1 TaxID=1389203 RepID=A0A9Q3JYJ8_9BASI|nr:hypothetical protein [Austropuccinia psidii MF-1]
MSPGHVGENLNHGPVFGPQQNWAQGVSNSPHGPQTAAYGPKPMDRRTPKDQNGQKWPYIKNFNKITQDPKRSKRAIKPKFIKNNPRKAQGPKYYGKANGGISKANGDKIP